MEQLNHTYPAYSQHLNAPTHILQKKKEKKGKKMLNGISGDKNDLFKKIAQQIYKNKSF